MTWICKLSVDPIPITSVEELVSDLGGSYLNWLPGALPDEWIVRLLRDTWEFELTIDYDNINRPELAGFRLVITTVLEGRKQERGIPKAATQSEIRFLSDAFEEILTENILSRTLGHPGNSPEYAIKLIDIMLDMRLDHPPAWPEDV